MIQWSIGHQPKVKTNDNIISNHENLPKYLEMANLFLYKHCIGFKLHYTNNKHISKIAFTDFGMHNRT